MIINELILYTQNVPKQLHFYSQVLGLSLLTNKVDRFTVKAGSSKLTFRQGQEHTQYHFAFNIPPHQIEEACAWVNSHLALLPFAGNDVVDFPDWNARAVYFHDADANIVEFIARKNQTSTAQKTFTPQSILNISEIGIPAHPVAPIVAKVKETMNVSLYSGDRERFVALGSESGLLIVIDYTLKKWIPTMVDANPHPLEAVLQNKKGYVFHLKLSRNAFELLTQNDHPIA